MERFRDDAWAAWWRDVCAGLDAGAAPAGACYVARGGEVLCQAVHGHATLLPEPEPLTERHRFDLASVSKPVAGATCALVLWQDGRLPLDAPLGDSAPALFAADHRHAHLTPTELLTHQSGLPTHLQFYRECRTREELCAAILATPADRPPREAVVYSDLGFMLLGFALESIAGQGLDTLFETRVTEPAGLAGELSYGPIPAASAVATEDCPWRGRVARGEVHDENCFVADGVTAHAGLFGTAPAVGRFAQKLMAGEVLGAEAMAELFKVRGDVAGDRFWLGWQRTDYGSGDPRCFSHDGFTGTLVFCSPREELVVVLLTNRVHPTRDNRLIYDYRPGWFQAAVALAIQA
jgi:CubicO group peptidase (beta-lactamase class C family)